MEKHPTYLAHPRRNPCWCLTRNCAICKFNGVTIQRGFNAHHSRPLTPSKPISKVNSLVKYLIYSLNSQPRADLCTAPEGKTPSPQGWGYAVWHLTIAVSLKVTAEGVRLCSSKIKYKRDSHLPGCTLKNWRLVTATAFYRALPASCSSDQGLSQHQTNLFQLQQVTVLGQVTHQPCS